MLLSEEMSRIEAATQVLKAVSDPSRLRILKVLEDGELCGCHLVELLGFAQPTVSRHLSILRAAGLVRERKDGRWIHYRLFGRADFAGKILRAIRGLDGDDPTVLEDRARCRRFRAIPVSEFCASVKKSCE